MRDHRRFDFLAFIARDANEQQDHHSLKRRVDYKTAPLARDGEYRDESNNDWEAHYQGRHEPRSKIVFIQVFLEFH